MLYVICIEGPHGAGKSTLIEQLKQHNYICIDEGFLDMPSYPKTIQNQSLTMEFLWVQQWFKRLYDIKEQHLNENYLVFADRSPYSGCFYSRASEESQETMKQLIYQIFKFQQFTQMLRENYCGIVFKRDFQRNQQENNIKRIKEIG